MPVNLLLTVDDDMEAVLRKEAAIAGRSVEEEVRKRLMDYSGCEYVPLSPDDIANDCRPHLMLDLRAK